MVSLEVITQESWSTFNEEDNDEYAVFAKQKVDEFSTEARR